MRRLPRTVQTSSTIKTCLSDLTMQFRLASFSDWPRIAAYVARLPWMRDEAGLQYSVRIEEVKAKRSLEQNSRLWALLTYISQFAPQHMGGEWHSPEVWNEYLARRFLGMVPGPFGEGVRKSTAKLKVMEFSDYMNAIEEWARDQFDGFNFEYEDAA